MAEMTPATHGVERDGWSASVDYIGGRRDGQLSPLGWHGLYRDEFGHNLDQGTGALPPHYRLYIADNGLLHYVWQVGDA